MNKQVIEETAAKTVTSAMKLQFLLCVLLLDALIVVPAFVLLFSAMRLVGVCDIRFDIPLTIVGTFSFIAGVLIISFFSYQWAVKCK